MVTFFMGSKWVKKSNQDFLSNHVVTVGGYSVGGVGKLVTCLDREGGLPEKNSDQVEVTG